MTWWDVKAQLDGRQFVKRKIYNAAGTGAQWNTWNDPTFLVASQLDKRFWEHQGVWYPADTFPMGHSVDTLVSEHLRLLDLKPPNQEWAGVYYSQSGIGAKRIYDLTRPGQEYERHGKTLKAMVIFGPPCREKNVANGNKWANWPMPDKDSRGISDNRFKDTPDFIYDFVHHKDIYGEVPDDDVGEDMTMIYRVVQDPIALLSGKDSAVEQITEMMVSPLKEMPAAVIAIFKGLQFVTTSPWPTYPHTSYTVEDAIRLLNGIGESEPAATF